MPRPDESRSRAAPMTASDDRFHDSEFLQLVLEAGRLGLWSWDAVTDEVTWDAAMLARFGRPGETSLVHSFDDYLELVHPDDRDTTVRTVAEARAAGSDLAFEHRVVWPDGSVHWIEGRGRAVYDANGTFAGMIGVGLDVDDRRQIEEMRREAEALRANAELVQQLEDAQRLARIGSWRWDFVTDELVLSAEMRRQLGVSAPRTGQDLMDLWTSRVHPDDRPQFEETQARAVEQGKPYSIEHRVVVDGQTRHLVHRGEVVRDDAGQIVGVRGTTQDVTERRRAEAALLTTRGRLEQEQRAVEVLHEALIHPEFPELAGFDIGAQYLSAEVAADIGGDWYDAFPLPDGRIMLAVGDVSGHGIRAARLMAKLRHATRAYATLDPAPSSVLRHLDEFLTHFCEPEEFATVQLATLDADDGSMELVSAGHPMPLLIHHDAAEFVEVEGARALGIPLPLDGKSTLLTLPRGSALLFYTDGLVERRGEVLAAMGDGEARIAELTLADTGTRALGVCEAAVTACLLGVSREDDVCVLAVVREP
jgi:PAS domain-containing protein